MAEAAVVIASVAQRFRFSLAPGHTVEPIGLLTLRPKNGVWVMATPRQTATCEETSADIGETSP